MLPVHDSRQLELAMSLSLSAPVLSFTELPQSETHKSPRSDFNKWTPPPLFWSSKILFFRQKRMSPQGRTLVPCPQNHQQSTLRYMSSALFLSLKAPTNELGGLGVGTVHNHWLPPCCQTFWQLPSQQSSLPKLCGVQVDPSKRQPPPHAQQWVLG